mgnify:CR=1 FL=1
MAGVIIKLNARMQGASKEKTILTTESRQLVISLPKEGGKDMKEALKIIATSEHRTVSNKAFIILQEWVNNNSDEPRVTYDDDVEARY